jgi:signal transduction histidine kinase
MPRRAAKRRELLVDTALAAPLVALSLGGTVGEILGATGPTPPPAGGYAIAIVSSCVLVWRRQRPLLVAVGSFAVAAAYPLLGYPGWAPSVALFVALFSLTAFDTTRKSFGIALALCVAAYLVLIVPPIEASPLSPSVWGPVFALFWVALLGASAGRRRLDSEDRLRRAAEVAEVQARQRMADDRLQVARELHDVLAHTISVIAVQSGLAADALDDDVETARKALGTIRASTRQALSELRATLTILRAGPVPVGAEDGDADTGDAGVGEPGVGSARPGSPQPRLAQVSELADRARAAGLVVTLDVALGGRALSPALELTAYRVVQQALTNVIQHAQARSVEVGVRRTDGHLLVTVVDDGRGQGSDSPGFGIRGMRERVGALGGTLAAGPGSAGGYEVRAQLPI